jgi:hypothetical protein
MSDVPTVSFADGTYTVQIMEGLTLSWRLDGRRCVVKMECADQRQLFALDDCEWPEHRTLQ